MSSNICKNRANRHIYLHLQKHDIKEKSQVFFPSFLRNALLIQEFDSICMRCKYICLAPGVIPEPQRAKQHTPSTYFLDAQKGRYCNSVQNLCSLRVRESMPGYDLSHTGYIWNSFPGGCALSDKWYYQEQVWDGAMESVGTLYFCPRRDTLQKHQPGLPINCFSNLVILLDIVGEPGISVWCFLWVKCLHVCWPDISYAFCISHCCPVVFAPTALHSCRGCCLLTAAASSLHPSYADIFSSQVIGKAKDTVEYLFEFLSF